MKADIKDRIKEAMEIRKIRQAELVEKTGIDKGQLSSYLAGKYKPKQRNINLIAQALSVDEAWLMGFDVPMEGCVHGTTDTDENRKATAKRIQLALSNSNMIPQELADKSGIGKASISQYVNGSHSPGHISAQKMSKILNVNPLWLMGFDVDMKESIIPESPEEIEKEKFDKYKHIVDKYHFISTHSPDGASVVDMVLDREYAIAQQLEGKDREIKELKKELMPKRILAYYGKIAAAGKSYGFDDVIAGTIECPLTDESQRADYAIGISGNYEKIYNWYTSRIWIYSNSKMHCFIYSKTITGGIP